MSTWEYYTEAIDAGSFHPALGGDTAGDSLKKLERRLNAIGATGWELLSVQRMTHSDRGYDEGPSTVNVYYECVFRRTTADV